MCISIVETYGSSIRVLDSNQNVIHSGTSFGTLMGYSSDYIVFRQENLVVTTDEHGRTMGMVGIQKEAQVFGITNSGFLVRWDPKSPFCTVYDPACQSKGVRNI